MALILWPFLVRYFQITSSTAKEHSPRQELYMSFMASMLNQVKSAVKFRKISINNDFVNRERVRCNM